MNEKNLLLLWERQSFHQKERWMKKYRSGKALRGSRSQARWFKEVLISPLHVLSRWEEKKNDEDARFVWWVILTLGGHASEERIAAFLRSSNAAQGEGEKITIGGRKLKRILKSLHESALVFFNQSPDSPYYYWRGHEEEGPGEWVIPEIIGETILGKEKNWSFALNRIREPSEHDGTVPASPEALPRDLLFFWGNAWHSPMKLLVAGHISKRDFRSLQPYLHNLEPDAQSAKESAYVRFLHRLLPALGLARSRLGYLSSVISPAGRPPDFWSFSESKMHSLIWQALGEVEWNFVSSSMQEIIGERSGGKLSRRLWKSLRKELKRSRAGEAISLAMIWKWILTGLRGKEVGFFEGDKRTEFSELPIDVEIAAAKTVARVFHWLGVADLLTKRGVPVGISLTPVGLSLLEGRSSSLEAGTSKIVVQPNFQVLAIGPVSLRDLALLEVVGRRVKAEKGVVEYRLDRLSFLNALASGLDGKYAVRYLEKTTGPELPQNVRRSLDEWLEEYERVTLYEGGILVEARDPKLLRSLLSGISRQKIIYLGETKALVPSSMQEKIEKASLRQGVIPEIVEGPGEMENQVVVSPDGRIRPLVSAPNLYLINQINLLADPQPDGTWLLTEGSIRRAASRMETKDILALLRKMSAEPVPKAVKTQVLIWSGFFGEVQAMKVTLLKFRNADALNAARKIPGLSRLLKEFPLAPGTGLAVVRDGKLSEVLSRLEEHGIRVKADPEVL